MTNKALARPLKDTAALIELTGGNPFRARAFASAARTLERMEESAAELTRAELTAVRGIGKSIAGDVRELVETGTLAVRDELLATLPPELPDVLRVKGLGPKKVRRLWQDLGVTSLDDLEAAAVAGRIADLDGFGAKTQDTILAQIDTLRTYQGRRHFATAHADVAPLLAALREADGVAAVEPAGAFRRALETVGEVELVTAGNADAVRAVLDAQGCTGAQTDGAFFEGALPDGLALVVHHTEASRFGVELWVRTGSPDHVAAFVEAHGQPDEADTEAAVYERVGLAVVPPELREGTDELQRAAAGSLPDLVTLADLRGSLHNHSTYSDGAHTLRDMAEAARASGLTYFGICDHSRSLKVANGLSIERLREQIGEVRVLNAEYEAAGIDFRVFSGSEVDILKDGSLDYPDEVLAELDLVVASVHTHFSMTEAEATERIVRAVSHPHVHILGHPTGRLLLRREGYPLDHAAVIEACAAHGVALELNANPYRLDLDWRYVRAATDAGVLVAINPDAHSIEQLDLIRWGVAVARKGGLTAAQCLNAMERDAFAAWLVAKGEAVSR
ncbi:MAG: helix-hairpin-helix domain-containing protein [Bacteroidota bacterium]